MPRPKSAFKRKRVDDAGRAFRKKTRVASRLFKAIVPRLGEIHFADVESAHEFSTTLGLQLLNGTVPGDDVVNRTGRHISMQSLKFRYDYQVALDANNVSPDYCRMLIVYDKQSNGVAPTWANVVSTVTAAAAVTTSSRSPKSEINRDRFVILRDIGWHSPIVGASGASRIDPAAMPMSGTMYIKLNGLPVAYNAGTAGTVADIVSGGLFVMTQGLTAAGATAAWSVNYVARLYFKP